MGILSLERVKILPQDGLTAHGIYQGNLHARELDVRRHQVNAFRVVQDALTLSLIHILVVPERRFVRFLLEQRFVYRAPSGNVLPYAKAMNTIYISMDINTMVIIQTIVFFIVIFIFNDR